MSEGVPETFIALPAVVDAGPVVDAGLSVVLELLDEVVEDDDVDKDEDDDETESAFEMLKYEEVKYILLSLLIPAR